MIVNFDRFTYIDGMSSKALRGQYETFKVWFSNITIMSIPEKQEMFNWLADNGYFEKPASLNHHGKNYGDLFRHSYCVAETLSRYTTNLGLEWQRPESPMIVGLFHDLCKVDNYTSINTGRFSKAFEYNEKSLLKGHGDKSVMMLSTLMKLTEEMFCIRYHMGAYNTNEWEQFDLAI